MVLDQTEVELVRYLLGIPNVKLVEFDLKLKFSLRPDRSSSVLKFITVIIITFSRFVVYCLLLSFILVLNICRCTILFCLCLFGECKVNNFSSVFYELLKDDVFIDLLTKL